MTGPEPGISSETGLAHGAIVEEGFVVILLLLRISSVALVEVAVVVVVVSVVAVVSVWPHTGVLPPGTRLTLVSLLPILYVMV